MAQLIWTEPALSDLDAIADYIAIDKPDAAKAFVQRVFSHIEQLEEHPESGSVVRELPNYPYRQIVEPPCRIFYRFDGTRVFVLHVMRGEMRLRKLGLRHFPENPAQG
ncbi:MAG: type II toxin-antitoxin system RelE/ParE family toxin [Verrucomicrobiota bacterium]